MLQYYKPWDLLSSEDARIKAQINETENTIQEQVARFEAETGQVTTEVQAASKSPMPDSKLDPEQQADSMLETVGPETNDVQGSNGNAGENITDKKADTSPPLEPQQVSPAQQENSKDHEDDGDEMVEADEDMVIY